MLHYQIENFGKSYEYRSNVHENWVVPPHIHEFSEIVFTKKGTATVIVDGERYRLPAHHLLFILPNQVHEYTNETASVIRCAVFSNDHIPVFFNRVRDARLSEPVLDLSGDLELIRALDAVHPADTLKICGLLNILCSKLWKKSKLCSRKSGENILLYEMIQYISQNFLEDIHLKDVAKKLGYHEKYLSASLHGLTNMNFRSFLASYRVHYAVQLLQEPEKLRISEVALKSGFSSVNTFNRSFKEIMGKTPTEYREQIS